MKAATTGSGTMQRVQRAKRSVAAAKPATTPMPKPRRPAAAVAAEARSPGTKMKGRRVDWIEPLAGAVEGAYTHHVYVLSSTTRSPYTGSTGKAPATRLAQHNAGHVKSTRGTRWSLAATIGPLPKLSASRLESAIKRTSGLEDKIARARRELKRPRPAAAAGITLTVVEEDTEEEDCEPFLRGGRA